MNSMVDAKRDHGMKKDNSTLDEREIITIIKDTLANFQSVQNHFLDGDDADDDNDVGYATLLTRSIAINTDTLVQSTDIPPCMTLRQAAKKSFVSCISDFAAKGVQPNFATISVNIPKYATRQDVLDVAHGFADATCEYNIKVVAGDTNAGKEFVFNVCLIGNSKGVVRRSGASIGDVIFVTGPFGYAALGLEMILADDVQRFAQEDKDNSSITISNDNSIIKNDAIKSVLEPNVHLKFMTLCISYVTSSMDSSDGLAATLNEMSLQSQCEFEIHTIPTTQNFLKYVRKCNKDLKKLVFFGGEEYETVFTVPSHNVNDVVKLAQKLQTPIIEIGKVVKKIPHPNTSKVYLKDEAGDKIIIENSGWDHFESA